MLLTNGASSKFLLFSEHSPHGNITTYTIQKEISCPKGTVMGPLVFNASPFLFPCTIEYSLICAVILFEIWKKVKMEEEEEEGEEKKSDKGSRNNLHGIQNMNKIDRLVTTNFHFSK